MFILSEDCIGANAKHNVKATVFYSSPPSPALPYQPPLGPSASVAFVVLRQAHHKAPSGRRPPIEPPAQHEHVHVHEHLHMTSTYAGLRNAYCHGTPGSAGDS
jgi:hypothetical protein